MLAYYTVLYRTAAYYTILYRTTAYYTILNHIMAYQLPFAIFGGPQRA